MECMQEIREQRWRFSLFKGLRFTVLMFMKLSVGPSSSRWANKTCVVLLMEQFNPPEQSKHYESLQYWCD